MSICKSSFYFPKMTRLTCIATQTISRLLYSSYAPIPVKHISSFPIFSLIKKPRLSGINVVRPAIILLHSSYSTLIARCFRPVFHAAPKEFFSFSPSTRSTVIFGHWLLGDMATLNSSDSYPTPDWIPPLRAPTMDDMACDVYDEDDDNHWIVVTEISGYEFETEQALFNYYIETLASAVGSLEEAKRRIYFVSTQSLFGFGADIDEETADQLDKLPDVIVLQDKYHLSRNKHPLGSRFAPTNWNHRIDDIFSYHHLSECNSEWKSDHWLVHIKQPDGEFITRQQAVELYLQILAQAVGSEEEAKRKLYIIWCKTPFGFGAEIDEQTVNKLKADPNVQLVLPDYSFDVVLEDCYALVVCPLFDLKSESTYCYYQPSQVHSENPEESMEKSMDELVPLNDLMDQNNYLRNIFSHHHLSEWNPQWTFDHWLIVIKIPEGGFTMEGHIIDFGIKILAEIVGSEQKAKEKIYIVWCKYPCGFGAEIDAETSNKLQGSPHVLKVLPDYGFDVKYKASRGPLFISSRCNELRYRHYNVWTLPEVVY